MELIGRSIDEGETVHGADWNSIWWSAVGSGTIVPADNMCRPEIASIEGGYHRGIRVKSGRVLYKGEIYDVKEQEIGLMNNLGKEKRYDLAYLKFIEEEDQVELEVKIGEPSEEEAFHPELIEENEDVVVPIAVIFLEKDATEITELKDVRSVPDAEHLHRAGLGLYLDENYKANVYVDEKSLKITNDEVTLGTLGGHELDLEDGEGIEYEEIYDDTAEEYTFIYRVDEGNGLAIGSSGEVEATPSDVPGAALEVSSDTIDLIDGDGLQITNGQLVARVGKGTQISSGKVAADVLDGRGAAAGSSGIEVITSDLAGSGLGSNSGNLEVNGGAGLQLNNGNLEVNRGEGITGTNGQIGLDLQSGGGLGIDDNNALYAEAGPSAEAGDGLYEDSSNEELHVGEGDGITTSADAVNMDPGNGVQILDGKIEAHVDPGGGIMLDDGLTIDPADIAGPGLTASSGNLHVNPGAGMQISSGELTTDLQSGGGFTKGVGLEAVPSDFAGNSSTSWTKVVSGQVEIAPEDIFEMIGEKTVTIDTEGQREGIWFNDHNKRYPVVIGIAFLDQAGSITAGIQVKKVMEDWNTESGSSGNDFFAGVECVGTIGGDSGSAQVLIRVYEVKMDGSWSYNY